MLKTCFAAWLEVPCSLADGQNIEAFTTRWRAPLLIQCEISKVLFGGLMDAHQFQGLRVSHRDLIPFCIFGHWKHVQLRSFMRSRKMSMTCSLQSQLLTLCIHRLKLLSGCSFLKCCLKHLIRRRFGRWRHHNSLL